MAISGPVCPECGATAILQDASAVYGPKFAGKFNIWCCPKYPECDCYIGCAPGAAPAPLGTMANRETRKARKALYDALPKNGLAGLRVSTMNATECRTELARLGIATQKGIYDE